MEEDRERNSKGRFTPSHDVTKSDVFDAMTVLEPYTSREIADEMGIPRRTAYKFLEELAESGRIRKKKPEARNVIWIRPAE